MSERCCGAGRWPAKALAGQRPAPQQTPQYNPPATSSSIGAIHMLSRRNFLAASAATAGVALTPHINIAAEPNDVFKISLAQWSLHRAFRAKGDGKLDALKFAEISAKDYGINAI